MSPVPTADAIQDPLLWRHRAWLVCICLGMLLFMAQVTAFFPVLPLYLVQRWGEATPVGLVVGSQAVGVLLLRPLIGWALDRWGRKPMILVGMGLAILVQPLYFWAAQPHWLIPVRILHGFSQAAVATGSQTLLADLVPLGRRTALLGYLAMCNTIGFALGPWLGNHLFVSSGFGAFIGGSTGLLGLALLCGIALPYLKPLGRPDATARPSPWMALARFPVREATFCFFVSSLLHGAITTFLPLWIEDAAQFYSLYALGAVLVRLGLGRWGDRIPYRWSATLALICLGTALVGLAGWPQLLLVWAGLYSLGFGTMFPVMSAMVSLAVPAEQRGRVFSLFLMGFDLGMTCGGVGMGALQSWFSLGPLFCLWGGIALSTALVAHRQFARPIPAA